MNCCFPPGTNTWARKLPKTCITNETAATHATQITDNYRALSIVIYCGWVGEVILPLKPREIPKGYPKGTGSLRLISPVDWPRVCARGCEPPECNTCGVTLAGTNTWARCCRKHALQTKPPQHMPNATSRPHRRNKEEKRRRRAPPKVRNAFAFEGPPRPCGSRGPREHH